MVWGWSFLVYGFLGFLLEVAYARATGGRPDRKCLVVLPLCPVYGLGACLILALTAPFSGFPPLVFALGGGAATGAEYLTGLFYERALGVSFWDYRGLPGNVGGLVCLPFALAWGTLALPLVYAVHPFLSRWMALLPPPLLGMALATFGADALLSALLLRHTGSRDCLKWYA